MNINDLLALQSPEKYDLKDEKKYTGIDSYERMTVYKKSNDKFDCDGSGEGKREENYCDLVRQIYRAVWGWQDIEIDINGIEFVKRYAKTYLSDKLLFGPETMNSFLTTYKQFEKCNQNDNEFYYLRNLWANIVGRIGNMTLTYQGFNKYIAYDYWDLKLKYQYLENVKLNETAKNRYVNFFFQWDYVKINGNRYEYKEFWELHETKYLPNNVEIIKDYIKKIDTYTLKRGLFLCALLKIISTCNEDYYKIRDSVFISDELFDSFISVINRALNLNFKNNETVKILKNVKDSINDLEKTN